MKFLAVFLLVLYLFCFSTKSGFVLYDPLSRPNNFHGIHILFPSELSEAAALVNSAEGEWGYVTIPIQLTDLDLVKWQKFMNDCKTHKLIPIIRLSTNPFYENTAVWAKPTKTNILDFANFLDSLTWPIENRYILVFNEVNRFDEWGGEAPNPKEYADLLSYAYEVFKDRDTSFYIILSGLDNASPNDRVKYMDNLVFLREMQEYNPLIFDRIDGFSSHSYPNPGFIAPPLSNRAVGITTYQFEYNLINAHSSSKKPAFITETGWDSSKLAEGVVASYYETAYNKFWNNDSDKIVAITPFLLNSQGGTFDIFSFVKEGRRTEYYDISVNMEKKKGEPIFESVKGLAVDKIEQFRKLTREKKESNNNAKNLVVEFVKLFF